MSVTIDLTPYQIMETLSPKVREKLLAYYSQAEKTLASYELVTRALIDNSPLVEKSFDTVFKDVKMLEKTLDEHGCQDIKFESENRLSCFFEHYIAVFFRENRNEPFKVTLACPNTYDLAEKVTELTSEYTMNAQEASYFKIKEKIEEKNYSIESEEVFDDNTIVLTINIS